MDNIKLHIFGSKELVKLFDELTLANQNKIIKAGFRKSGNIILKQAKINLASGKKNTIKKRIERAFRMEDLKYQSFDNTGQTVGINIGNQDFRARWLEGGTKERMTKGLRKLKRGFRKGQTVGKTIHSTGKITAIHFLEKATETKGPEAVESLFQNIKNAFDLLIKKYSK